MYNGFNMRSLDPIKTIVIIVSLLILTSCSKTRLIYNYSDWFLLKRFDTYFDLNTPQRSNLEIGISKLLTWHRQSELVKIAEHIKQLKSRYQNKLKGEDIEWMRDEHKIFWERILNHAEPDLIKFLSTVEEKQIQQMEKALIERDDWLVKQARMTPEEIHASTLEWLFGLLEDWLGDLEPDQKLQISNWIIADPEWVAIKLENRNKNRTTLAELLRSKENLAANLHIWMHQPENHWTQAFTNRIEDKKKEWKEIILKVDAITLPHQRQHAADALQSYMDDFLFLSQQAPS